MAVAPGVATAAAQEEEVMVVVELVVALEVDVEEAATRAEAVARQEGVTEGLGVVAAVAELVVEGRGAPQAAGVREVARLGALVKAEGSGVLMEGSWEAAGGSA